MNKTILSGHVGTTPEVQTINSGDKVAKFTLATNETFKNKSGEKVTNTTWHNIVVWKGIANVVEQYVKKGDKLLLVGKINNRQYEKDGQTKYFTEIVCNYMEMLGNKGESKPKDPANDFNDVDNLPF